MEIDCPIQAVAVWTEGDKILIRFPDRQLIDIPATAPMTMLLNILQPREKAHRSANGHERAMRVGTACAPVQYDIDAIAAELGLNEDKSAKKAADKRARLLREDARRQARREADELLALCGL